MCWLFFPFSKSCSFPKLSMHKTRIYGFEAQIYERRLYPPWPVSSLSDSSVQALGIGEGREGGGDRQIMSKLPNRRVSLQTMKHNALKCVCVCLPSPYSFSPISFKDRIFSFPLPWNMGSLLAYLSIIPQMVEPRGGRKVWNKWIQRRGAPEEPKLGYLQPGF